MQNKRTSITRTLSTIHSIISNLQIKNRLIPTRCILCNQYQYQSDIICADCSKFITPILHACQYCATPLANPNINICNSCTINKPYVDKVFTSFAFEEPLRMLIHLFKYKNGLYLSTFLAKLMLASQIPTNTIECLIPVPLSKQRLRTRGFNQATILTKILAKQLNIKYDTKSVKKVIDTPAQANTNAISRKKNVINAFYVDKLPYKNIAIVDDLITTGSTANAIAKLLKANGAKNVYLWCCARATYTYTNASNQ